MDFDVFRATLLALIQGLTEFLPISSSAHLILPSELFGWQDQGLNFDMALHFGSLLAVLVYFRRDLLKVAAAMLQQIVVRGASTADSRLGWYIILATIPVTIAGLLLEDLVETRLRSVHVIIATTLFYGMLLGIADWQARQNREMHDISWRTALMIGLAQMLAIIPGTSRSGVTMTAALFCGLKRDVAARFSFLMAIPTIFGAGLLEGYKVYRSGDWSLAYDAVVGGGLAFVFGLAAIAFMMAWLRRASFTPFVVYRLCLGAILMWIVYGA